MKQTAKNLTLIIGCLAMTSCTEQTTFSDTVTPSIQLEQEEAAINNEASNINLQSSADLTEELTQPSLDEEECPFDSEQDFSHH